MNVGVEEENKQSQIENTQGVVSQPKKGGKKANKKEDLKQMFTAAMS